LTIARGLVKLRGIVSGVSVALVCVLIVVSLFLMSNTIKLATVERREEIAIMRMVGATKAFIRWPFVFEGFVLGMVGALAAYVVEWSIYNAAIKILMPSGATLQLITLVPFSGVALPLLALYVAIGFSVGVLGSLWAIRRYIKV
ncbi:MAG: FtsX-like permease family protein, partial [Oscillospiraceae bacterium]|nr:FtsX-like permease family protein [Oscillospiraceae bacterium]